jgi:two-component system response regulator NreC
MSLQIVLADDHVVVRSGFRMIIEQQIDMAVIGEASNPDETLILVRRVRPDILITDISMGTEKNGLLLVEQIHEEFPSIGIVVLSMHSEQEYLRQALHRGAYSYVLKSATDEELIKAIRYAARQDLYVSEGLMSNFVRDSLSGQDPARRALSPRETEIVSLAVKGHANQEIAHSLNISVKTVESQKARIMTKLGITSKPELFDYAITHNLI